jgi:hypothetical protein
MYAFILGWSRAVGDFCFGIYLAWKTSLPSAPDMKVVSVMMEIWKGRKELSNGMGGSDPEYNSMEEHKARGEERERERERETLHIQRSSKARMRSRPE